MYLSSAEDEFAPRSGERPSDIFAEMGEPAQTTAPPPSAPTSMREQFSKLRSVRDEDSRRREAAARAARRARRPHIQWRALADAASKRLDEVAFAFRDHVTDSTVARLTVACADLSEKRYRAALAKFERVLADDDRCIEALDGKAQALIGLKRFEDAVTTYARIVEIAPSNVPARYNYGALLYRLGCFGDATWQFRVLLEYDRDHARAHYNLATLAQRAGRLAEAMDEWERFTLLEPDVAEAWFNLGIIYMDYSRPMDAVTCFQQVIEIDPSDVDGRLNLGLAYADAGALRASLSAMQSAQELSPCDPVVLALLADVHEALATIADDAAEREAQLSLAADLRFQIEMEAASNRMMAATHADADN